MDRRTWLGSMLAILALKGKPVTEAQKVKHVGSANVFVGYSAPIHRLDVAGTVRDSQIDWHAGQPED